MSPREVWFAIPSASLERCRKSLPVWKQMGYRVAVLQDKVRGEVPADIIHHVESYPGWAESVNILCTQVVPKSADIIVTGGCDMFPDPKHTAQQLADQFYAKFPDGFGVMQPQGDDFLAAKSYCGSPFLGRRWIDTMYQGRGPMFGGYHHNWADNELFWLAKCTNALWERPDLTHYHEHFSRIGEAPPEFWTRNAAKGDQSDVQLFIARAWQNFPGSGPLDGSRCFDAARFQREYRPIAEAYWISRYGQSLVASDAHTRMHAAMLECHRRGETKVAIFGAGTHTRSLSALLMDPPVRVACIIDQDPKLAGRSLWNYRIVTVSQAGELGVTSVILSSQTMEDAMEASLQPLLAHGVRVIRLYPRKLSA